MLGSRCGICGEERSKILLSRIRRAEARLQILPLQPEGTTSHIMNHPTQLKAFSSYRTFSTPLREIVFASGIRERFNDITNDIKQSPKLKADVFSRLSADSAGDENVTDYFESHDMWSNETAHLNDVEPMGIHAISKLMIYLEIAWIF